MLEDSQEKAILMTRNVLWHDLYKTAMLELDPVKLHKRIEAAYAAMQQRIQELRSEAHGSSLDEQQAIADALHSLQMLQRVEFRVTRPNPQTGATRPSLGPSQF